jgi:predicted kinase
MVIVTGSPGAGKTTLAAHLAQRAARGVHVRGDAFFAFLAQPIAPVLAESHAQNATVLRATARATAAFATGDYEVFLDGIFGPWFLPVLAAELAPSGVPVDYVILRLALDQARTRATTRTTDPAEAHVVEQMHAAFASLAGWDGHVLDVDGHSTEEIADEVARRSAAGLLRLDLGRIVQPGRR